MLDCLIDAELDTLKVLPYLLVAFLILELIEHKFGPKNALVKHRRLGPVFGGLLGGLPQCGFSAMVANLFASHLVTIGTVVAVFLATSDEMLPIMLGEGADIWFVLRIILFKVAVGITIGLLVDIFWKRYKNKKQTEPIKSQISHLCEKEHCHCEKHGIFVSSLEHTLKTGLFLLVANIIIGLLILYAGEENIANFTLSNPVVPYLLTALVGLIPNCAGSVIITELYLGGLISLGSMMAGLLAGSGVGLLLLFKNNNNSRENRLIVAILYATGVIVGALIDLF